MHDRGVLQEMESVVTRARHFQFKPDGDVTFMMAQDAVGLPAPLMQVCPPHPATLSLPVFAAHLVLSRVRVTTLYIHEYLAYL